MSEKVVCNASPLIFLAKVQQLDLLNNYDLFIPSQVEMEIVRGLKHKRENAIRIIEYFEKRHIKPERGSLITNLPHFLGLGERAVISLAVREKIEKVLGLRVLVWVISYLFEHTGKDFQSQVLLVA